VNARASNPDQRSRQETLLRALATIPNLASQYFVRLNLNPSIEKRRQSAALFTIIGVLFGTQPPT
jgi:hypothetical protein